MFSILLSLTQQRLKHVFIFKCSLKLQKLPCDKMNKHWKTAQHLFPLVHFQTVPCFPCELSSLILSVIYKWIFSLVHVGVPLSGVSSPVSSFLICPKHLRYVTPGKDRTNCSKSVTPESEMSFLKPITHRHRWNRSHSVPLETNDLEMKEGEIGKGKQRKRIRKSIYHTWE